MSFSFSFSGDDIEAEEVVSVQGAGQQRKVPTAGAESAGDAENTAASAFPVQGKPQLPPIRHSLQEMLARLPSKIAYGLVDVVLDAEDDSSPDARAARAARIRLPRRELWDVRLQVMAEAEDEADESSGEIAPGLGSHDVKTGIYEGGFKSWESSMDLVKVLLRPAPAPVPAEAYSLGSHPSAVAGKVLAQQGPAHIIELGCGTALPSLALFQWACATRAPPVVAGEKQTPVAEQPPSPSPLSFTVADYNPSVLHLVTLPNLLLVWALQRQNSEPALLEALSDETDETAGGELELTDAVKDAFCSFLEAAGITLSLLSGGWSPAFTELLFSSTPRETSAQQKQQKQQKQHTLVLGAETIYSPFALEAFSDTLMTILERERPDAVAVIGAKKLYFGVGGSLDDFVQRMRQAGAQVSELREEADGVRRGVVQCLLA